MAVNVIIVTLFLFVKIYHYLPNWSLNVRIGWAFVIIQLQSPCHIKYVIFRYSASIQSLRFCVSVQKKGRCRDLCLKFIAYLQYQWRIFGWILKTTIYFGRPRASIRHVLIICKFIMIHKISSSSTDSFYSLFWTMASLLLPHVTHIFCRYPTVLLEQFGGIFPHFLYFSLQDFHVEAIFEFPFQISLLYFQPTLIC